MSFGVSQSSTSNRTLDTNSAICLCIWSLENGSKRMSGSNSNDEYGCRTFFFQPPNIFSRFEFYVSVIEVTNLMECAFELVNKLSEQRNLRLWPKKYSLLSADIVKFTVEVISCFLPFHFEGNHKCSIEVRINDSARIF